MADRVQFRASGGFSAVEAVASVTIAAASTVYVEASVAYPDVSLELWHARDTGTSPPSLRFDLSGSPATEVELLNPDFDSNPYTSWWASAFTDPFSDSYITAHLQSDTWHLVKYRYRPVAPELEVDGDTTAARHSGNVDTINVGVLGSMWSGTNYLLGRLYLRTLKVGTTAGASDLFSFDAATDTLAVFDAVAGDVTLVTGAQVYAPTNAAFAAAEVITGATGTSTVVTDNREANTQTSEPNYYTGVHGRHMSAWYQWVAPADGAVTFDAATGTTVENDDATIAVWTGASLGALTIATGNFTDAASLTGEVVVDAVEGETYWVQQYVTDYRSIGSYALSWDLFVPQAIEGVVIAFSGSDTTLERDPTWTRVDV